MSIANRALLFPIVLILTVVFGPVSESLANERLYTVQVQATQDESVVQDSLMWLRENGYKPFVLSINDRKGRTWQTVHIATFRVLQDARERLNSFKNKTGKNAVIVPTTEQLYRRFVLRRSKLLVRLKHERAAAAELEKIAAAEAVAAEKAEEQITEQAESNNQEQVASNTDSEVRASDQTVDASNQRITDTAQTTVNRDESQTTASSVTTEASETEVPSVPESVLPSEETPSTSPVSDSLAGDKGSVSEYSTDEKARQQTEEQQNKEASQREDTTETQTSEVEKQALRRSEALQQQEPVATTVSEGEAVSTDSHKAPSAAAESSSVPYLWILLSLLLLAVIGGLLLKVRQYQQAQVREQKRQKNLNRGMISIQEREHWFDFPKTIPLSRLSHFVGRRNQLLKLRGALIDHPKGANASPQVVYGMGGIGKTELVVEYAYRHLDDYQSIWWINGHIPTIVAQHMGLDQADISSVWASMQGWFSANKNWLMVLDNVDDPQQIMSYLPEGEGHIVITTRHANWDGRFNMQRLNAWSKGKAKAFIEQHDPEMSEASVTELARTLGGFPLALQQSMTHIAQLNLSARDYLQQYQRDPLKFLSMGQSATARYSRSLVETWMNSIERVRRSDSVAMGTLNLLAFLDSKDIPKSLILDDREQLPAPLDRAEALADLFAFHKKVIKPLSRNALIMVDRDSLSQHSLLQTVLREQLTVEERMRWVQVALNLISKVFQYKPHQTLSQREQMGRLLAHAMVIANHAEQNKTKQVEQLAGLLDHISRYLADLGRFEEAKDFCSRAVTMTKTDLGSSYPEYSARLNTLGSILKSLGLVQDALSCFRKAEKIDLQRFGADYLHLAVYKLNMGTLFYLEKNWQEAEKHYKKSYQLIQKNGAMRTGLAVTCLINLGHVRWMKGDASAAKRYFEEALRTQKIYQLDQLTVALDIQMLPEVIDQLTELDAARTLQKESSRDMFQSMDEIQTILAGKPQSTEKQETLKKAPVIQS
ncbi:tetratricopeptide repeat protein, partial [Magnetococcales bacterium HHB-1]